jgi:methylated-DNA-[protein]-cysteine S-methyltransferase
MSAALLTARTSVHVFPSQLGWMATLWEGATLLELSFGFDSPQRALRALTSPPGAWSDDDELPEVVRRLQAFSRGERVDFRDVPLARPVGGAFAQAVIEQCRTIPFGETRTYGEMAALAGSPRAARAVGNTMATNRTPLVVPCHRVVPTGGKLGGYSAGEGVRTKLRLLEMEAVMR